MEELKTHIKKVRDHLSESSIKTYCNCLKNLFNDIFPKEDFNYKLLISEHEKVLNHLKQIKYNVRKTLLSALVVISEDKEKVQNAYRKMMIEDAEKYNAEQKKNKMTPQQAESWITWKEILDILEKLKLKYYYIFKEEKPSKDDILNLQKYIILSCYALIPPRRAMDYCEMKVAKFDANKDNYYLKSNFFFNKYKTAKFTGLQNEKVPKSLESLLKKWIAFRKTDYLFTDYYDKPLTSSGMTKILNSIFKPKNISVNMLRHIYITEKSAPLIKELEETATAMGHSTNQAKLYVKFA
jgi:hypothetical protein